MWYSINGYVTDVVDIEINSWLDEFWIKNVYTKRSYKEIETEVVWYR